MSNISHHNWYEEDFVSFLLSLNLPAYRKNTSIETILSTEKKSFASKFEKMFFQQRFRIFSATFYDTLSVQLPKIKQNFDCLHKILNSYNNADMSAAQTQFNDLMSNLKENLFIQNIYWPQRDGNFYRVRASTNEKLSKPEDLFHIPYSKRHLASNERYSMAGHPCLYLSSALQIAWEECGKPRQSYYSEFKYQESTLPESEWKFVIFLSPREVATTWFVTARRFQEEFYTKLAVDYLLTYPLIFACSIINLNGHSAFKQEFIIPQMLMQWVFRNYTEIKGIKYFSCNKSDEFLQYHGYNIVMPAIIDKNRKKYSKDLSQKFKVSKPSLVIYQFSDTEIIKVKKYKDDLLTLRSSIFSEAFDCLCKLYYVTSLLDCAIQNLDSTNTRLLISAVQNVRLTGYIIYEKYPIEDILEKGRASMLYTEQTEAVMEIFSTLYARFRPDVIDVAESFLKRINRPIQHIPDEFYTI